MIFKNIIMEYIDNNKKLVYSYILVASLIDIIKVIVLSIHYGNLMKDPDNFYENVKKVIYIWVFLCILFVIKTSLESELYSNILFYVRNILYKRYIRHNYFDFNDFDTGSDVTRIFEVSRTIRDVFYYVCQSIIPLVILAISINGYLFYTHPQVGAINLLSNIVNSIIVKIYFRHSIDLANIRQEKMVEILNKLQENFGSMMDIFLNNKDEESVEQYMLMENDHAVMHKKEFKNLGNFINLMKTNNYIFAIICIYVLYRNSDKETFLNGLLIFTFYMSAIQGLAEDIPKLVTVIGNMESIEKILEPKLTYEEKIDTGINISNVKGSIVFENITFSYSMDKQHKNILNNLNFIIKPGERIAIVSESGSGKTTIMKLLLKFYKPQQGRILLDNMDIATINTKDLRREINYINQKTILFNDTIINNMKYGNNKTDTEILNFLIKYDLLQFFNPDPNDMMTSLQRKVETNGINMSMGMQKIIFLVRGILKENSNVYIFDEPLSSLDPESRKKILQMINNEVRYKTMLIITHDAEVKQIVNKTIRLKDLQDKDPALEFFKNTNQ
jgi:ABC-type multidrug transport system fused ATPase/permease subunit